MKYLTECVFYGCMVKCNFLTFLFTFVDFPQHTLKHKLFLYSYIYCLTFCLDSFSCSCEVPIECHGVEETSHLLKMAGLNLILVVLE